MAAMTMRSVFAFMLMFCAVAVFCVRPALAQDDGQKICQGRKAVETKINISYDDIPVAYVLGKDRHKLATEFAQNYKANVVRNRMQVIWGADDLEIGGLAIAAFAVAVDSRMRSDGVDSMGVYQCPYFGEIDVSIFYTSTIAIGDDLPQNSCKFGVLNKHELKHTQSNKAMVDQYVVGLEDDIRGMLPHIEGGYVGSAKIAGRQEEMKADLSKAITDYLTDAVKKGSASINAQIDTDAEYQNLNKLFHLCDVRDAYYKKHPEKLPKKAR